MTLKVRKLINEKFDKMHAQRKINWFIKFISFVFSVFVIYKIVYVDLKKIAKRKEKVIINIRGLNKIIISNNHSIPFQKDIVIVIQKYIFINVIDCNEQFHLFLIKKNHR